jgi:hypothetical protein
MPHGGPHSAFGTAWAPSLAFKALLGYTLVLPNYRGSFFFFRMPFRSSYSPQTYSQTHPQAALTRGIRFIRLRTEIPGISGRKSRPLGRR